METSFSFIPAYTDGHIAGEAVPLGDSTGIRLVQMPQQALVRAREDDWTGIVDRGERRKLQSRLSQRAYRKSYPPWTSARLGHGEADINAGTRMQAIKNKNKELHDKQKSNDQPQDGAQIVPRRDNPQPTSTFSCTKAPTDAHEAMLRLELTALTSHARGNPNLDHLISLSKLNIQRALTDNTAAIGITMDWLQHDDSISVFNVSAAVPGFSEHRIPKFLQPTALQRNKPHHPWLDVFPFPRMRDNMIAVADDFDDEELCRDMMAFWDTRNTEATILVWGFPWDPVNWEVTEAFVRKWGWIVKGCEDLLESTNRWRGMRGEKRLMWR